MSMSAKQLLSNPIVKAAMKSAKDTGRTFGTLSTLIICVNVLNDEFGFTIEQLRDFYSKVDDLADSIIKDMVSFTDIVKALKEYYDFDIPEHHLRYIFGDDIPLDTQDE